MAEKFTWECLWQTSCGGCLVAEYVKDQELDDDQQKELLERATEAGTLLSEYGTNGEEVIEKMRAESVDKGLPEDFCRIAVDGYRQWAFKGCRETISAAEAV